MTIDPSKITVDDIDRYEQLMLGDGVQCISNANSNLDIKHTWQSKGDTATVGPLDLKLQ